LAHEDSQRREEVKNSQEMLNKWKEEIELLEKLLDNQDSIRKENAAMGKECSHMPNHDNFLNFLFNLKDVGIEESDEHSGIVLKLFPKDEFEPQL